MIKRTPSQIGLIINPQSFVDVITNSSSELFICNSDKSVSLVHPEVYLMSHWSDWYTIYIGQKQING